MAKGFKQSMKDAGNKVKNYSKSYVGDLRRSYDIGYSRGWDDAYDVPNRFLSKFVAGLGYRKGVKNRIKSDKYIKQYNKQNKQILGGNTNG
jgi:hypothetical protein